MFVSFLLGGRLLEVRARHRVAQVLESALAGMPETAQRLDAQGRAETVSVQRLAAGDRVRVPVGQAFPADGELLEGDTRADESLLTGESVPVAKPCGSAVVAGSLNLGSPVVMRLERVGEDTRLAGIVALMQQAMTERPALARAADRWAAPFLWTVLLLAAGAAAVWSVIDPSRAVWVAVSVLIVTCPCALSLAAPAALLSAASALARRGLLLQRLDALETLTRVQRIYLDKTGTLTDDRLRWQGLQRLADSPWSDTELRARAADRKSVV
jgi:Cu2+-exporting ATPase